MRELAQIFGVISLGLLMFVIMMAVKIQRDMPKMDLVTWFNAHIGFMLMMIFAGAASVLNMWWRFQT